MAYALAAVLPALVFIHVSTGPHPGYTSLPWMALPFLMAWAEGLLGRVPPREGAEVRPRWWHQALVYGLVALFFVNLGLLLRNASRGGFLGMDTLAAFQFFGVYTAFSGIVLGHELIHRRGRFDQLLGRLVCCAMLYEHFSTEHLRGHHVRGATEEDPATARFGETYWQFLRRSVPGQWRSAFQLECRRTGATGWWDWRILRSRVVHGLLLELALLGGILRALGPAALGVFLVQAAAAVCYLEAVNYFQHWGLSRADRAWHGVDAWETDARFSIFAMFALPRHVDHHMHMVRAYPRLQSTEESPQLPAGYLGTILRVLFANRRLREYLGAELERRGLGPFARPGELRTASPPSPAVPARAPSR